MISEKLHDSFEYLLFLLTDKTFFIAHVLPTSPLPLQWDGTSSHPCMTWFIYLLISLLLQWPGRHSLRYQSYTNQVEWTPRSLLEETWPEKLLDMQTILPNGKTSLHIQNIEILFITYGCSGYLSLYTAAKWPDFYLMLCTSEIFLHLCQILSLQNTESELSYLFVFDQ